ncbi:MAG: RNA ligase partner protein [Hydrogenobaculum sp.]|jgi:RNA ligase partner protein
MQDNVIIDTSIFTNPNIYKSISLGQPIDAIEAFIGLAHKSSKKIYMPRTVYIELCKVVDLESIKSKFESSIIIKSPNRCSITINALALFDFVEDMRIRINKGLRIAEEFARDKTQDIQNTISKLREKYKEALRQGTLDSKEDVDVILLALELNGVILSGDEGINSWADKFGIRTVNPLFIQEFLSF